MARCANAAAFAGITCSTVPAAAVTPRVLQISRREIPAPIAASFLRCTLPVLFVSDSSERFNDTPTLNISLARFGKQIVRSAPGERHDRERRIFVRVRDQ